MAAGAMRTVRAAQLLRQTRTVTRIAGVKVLSVPAVGQRRGQSTVADMHDAPQTGLQSGIQTGMVLLGGGVDGRVVVGGTDTHGAEWRAYGAVRDAHTAGTAERGLASEGYTARRCLFWVDVDLL
jgi:hypothetical protein